MAEWKFSGGNLDDMIAHMEAKLDLAKKRALKTMEELADTGGALMQDTLEDETTPTGEKRVADGRGEYAGRHVTGNAVASVSNHVEVIEESDTGYVVEAKWGWAPNEMEDYLAYQDEGRDKFKVEFDGAHSRAQSFVETRERLKAKIAALAGKGVGF